MTEQKPDVPVEGTEETKAPPTPAISPASEQVSSAETGFDAVAFEERISAKIEELSEKLPSLVDARFKSTTDKSFQDVRKVAQYLKKFDGNEELAIREMAIDRLLERQESEAGDLGRSPEPSAQVSQKDFETKTAEILEEAGIPLDDPEVIELAKSKVANEDDWYRRLAIHIAKKAKQGGITQSAIVTDSGAPIVPVKGEELLDEIIELQKHPVQNQAAIAEKMKQAKELGLLP